MICGPEKKARDPGKPGRHGRIATLALDAPSDLQPIGYSLTELVREELHRSERGGRSPKERLAEVIVKRALSGDYRFCRLILERIEPAPTDTTTDDSSMTVEEWKRCLRASDSPYGPQEGREALRRLLDAIDQYDREIEAMGDEEEVQLATEPYRPDPVILRSGRREVARDANGE